MLRSMLPLVLVTALAACSGNGESADAAAADAPAQTAAPAATAQADDAAAGAGRIQLVITGGAHAGTYDVADTDGCSHGLAEKGAWGNQFSRDLEDPRQLSSVQLIVPDSQGAAAGTQDFLITVAFGPLFGEGNTSYTVDTRKQATARGQGRVSVDDRGQSGTVNFDATTADGVNLKGTIECKGVVRA